MRILGTYYWKSGTPIGGLGVPRAKQARLAVRLRVPTAVFEYEIAGALQVRLALAHSVEERGCDFAKWAGFRPCGLSRREQPHQVIGFGSTPAGKAVFVPEEMVRQSQQGGLLCLPQRL